MSEQPGEASRRDRRAPRKRAEAERAGIGSGADDAKAEHVADTDGVADADARAGGVEDAGRVRTSADTRPNGNPAGQPLASTAHAAHTGRRTGRARSAPRYRRNEPDRERTGFKRSIAEWRIALRLGRRSVLRSVGTSAVVVAMVALPVAGFSAVALVGESSLPTPQEKITAELGQTQARLYNHYAPDPTLRQNPYDPTWVEYDFDEATGMPSSQSEDEPRDPRDLFPEGTRFIELHNGAVRAETANGIGDITTVIGPAWTDELEGRFDIVRGSTPSAPDEIMANESALERLDAEVGSTVELLDPERTVTVVGVLDDQLPPDDLELLFFDQIETSAAADAWSSAYFLLDTVIDRSEMERLNTQGVTVLSREILSQASVWDLNTSGSFFMQYGMVLVLAAAFAIFQVVLLAGAAFTVRARAQQRALATVASVGGGRKVLTRIVTAQGVVLGCIGGVIGVVLGIPAGSIFMALTGDGSAERYWGYHLNPLVMIGIVVLAMIVGLCAALIPARAASKVDVLAALRGSRKPVPPNKKAPVIGVVFMIGGAGLALAGAAVLRFLSEDPTVPLGASLVFWFAGAALVVGPILAQIGIIQCGALVLRLISRALSKLGLGARMASRDGAAYPSRTVPAFAAIMVTAFLAVMVINMAAANQRSSASWYTHMVPPGSAQIFLPQDDGAEGGEDARRDVATADDIADIAEGELPIDEMATVSYPRETYGRDGEILEDRVPRFAVPPQNLCPLNEQSPEYDPAFAEAEASSEARAEMLRLTDTDWRCDTRLVSDLSQTIAMHIVNARGLDLMLGREPSARAVEALESGGVVAFHRGLVFDDEATLDWWSTDTLEYGMPPVDGGEPDESIALPAVVEEPRATMQPAIALSPNTAERLGMDPVASRIVATFETPPTQAELDAATEALEGVLSGIAVENGPSNGALFFILSALGLCAILFVGASAVSIGLARADGRQDDATLAAVGATRMLRRNISFWQAVIIAGIGSVTGTTAGLFMSYAFSIADTTGSMEFVPPWLEIGALVVAMPLLIAIGSWLVASKPSTLVRRAAIG